MRNEKRLQTNILDDLRSYGKYCECFKIEKTSDNGTPDIFFTTNVTGAVFIEVKRTGKEAEKLQANRIKNLWACGCKAFVVASWEEWISVKASLKLSKHIFDVINS